jgi:tetratricopeptide (TPR) repeat protein
MKTKAFCIIVLAGLLLMFSINSMAGGQSPAERAKDLMEEGFYRDAIDVLEPEVKKWPKDRNIHLILGICYLNTGKYNLAAERFRSAAKDEKFKGKIAKECQKEISKLLRKGKLEEADFLFGVAYEYNPKIQYAIAEEYKNAGLVYLNTGKLEEAEKLLSRALMSNPQLGEKVAVEYLKAGQNYLDYQPEAAEKVFLAAASFSPALSEKICDIYFEKGKEGANKADFEFLEKAQRYCDKHEQEIVKIISEKLPQTATAKLVYFEPGKINETNLVAKRGDTILFLYPTASFRVPGEDRDHTINQSIAHTSKGEGQVVIFGDERAGWVYIQIKAK